MTEADRFLLSRLAIFTTDEEEVKRVFTVRSSKNWSALRQRSTREVYDVKNNMFTFGHRDDRDEYVQDCKVLAAQCGLDSVEKLRQFLIMNVAADENDLCVENVANVANAEQMSNTAKSKKRMKPKSALFNCARLAQFDDPWPRMGEFIVFIGDLLEL
jgi:hypothetical protein